MNDKARILSTLRPFLRFAIIVGLFAGNINGEKVTKSSILARFYCVIWLVVTYKCIESIYPQEITYFDIFTKGKEMRSFLKILVFFTVAGDTLISLFQQKQIIDVFENIDCYDRRLIELGFSRKDNRPLYWIFLGLPFLLYFFEITCMYLFVSGLKFAVDNMFTLAYRHFMSYFTVVKFGMYVDMIYRRFRYLNENVINKIETINGLTYKQRAVTIYEVRYLHAKLCKSANILTNVYGPWIIIWCFNIIYNFIDLIMRITKNRMGNASLACHFTKITILCVSCGLASSEANEIARRLLKQIPLSRNVRDTMDRIEMALYVSNNELTFTALSMYSINRTFFLAVASIVVTFVTFTFD